MRYAILVGLVMLALSLEISKPYSAFRVSVAQVKSAGDNGRVEHEKRLVEGGEASVPELVAMLCDGKESSVLTARRVVTYWEGRSWGDPAANRAVEKMTLAVRDLRSDRELWRRNRHRLDDVADVLRLIDVSNEEAKRILVAQGAELFEWQGRVTAVELFDWHGSPRDWRYIAVLASDERNTQGLSIKVSRIHDSPTFLTECLKNLRQARPYKIDIQCGTPTLNREGWQVLANFPRVVSLMVQEATADVRDEDIADAVSHFKEARVLMLPPTTGPLTIEAASKLPELNYFHTRSHRLTDADLRPLRSHEKLRHLTTLTADGTSVRFLLNGDGTGEWEREQVANDKP